MVSSASGCPSVSMQVEVLCSMQCQETLEAKAALSCMLA